MPASAEAQSPGTEAAGWTRVLEDTQNRAHLPKFIRFCEICRKTTGVGVRLPIPGPLDTIPRPRECVPAPTCGTCRTGRTPCLAQPGPAPCHGGASEQGGDPCFIGGTVRVEPLLSRHTWIRLTHGDLRSGLRETRLQSPLEPSRSSGSLRPLPPTGLQKGLRILLKVRLGAEGR